MTTEEKLDMLFEYGEKHNLSDEENEILFEVLKQFSKDKDENVRYDVAELIVRFVNEEAKDILLKLAIDKDVLVRIEAYDSLTIYIYKDVEKFLLKAIRKEKKNRLACYYAIKAWAEVTYNLNNHLSGQLKFVRHQKHSKRFQKSERCMLAWCFAEYLLNEEEDLSQLYLFLRSKDIYIRCSTVGLLRDLLSYSQKTEEIKQEIEVLLKREKSIAVKDAIKDFYEVCEYLSKNYRI